MLNEIKGSILQRIQRDIPGAFLWRARSEDDGSCTEEFISEGSSYQVMDVGLFSNSEVKLQRPIRTRN